MAEKPEEKQYIHWQELAEQLGSDTSKDIDDYFGGTTQLANVELDESELPDTLPAAPTMEEASEKTDETVEVEIASPVATATSDHEEPLEVGGGEIERPPSESDLEIGWTPPSSATPKSLDASDEERPARTKRKPAKKAKPARKEKPQDKEAAADPVKFGHWDDLASSLGIESDEPIAPRATKTSTSEEDVPIALDSTTPEESTSPPDDIRLASFADDDEPDPPENRESSFGAGIVEFEIERSDEEQTQANILSEMFVAPDEPYQEIDSETESVDESDGIDEDYVEFEVEDLDPKGQRPRGRRRPTSKRRTRDSEEASEETKSSRTRHDSETEEKPRRRKRRSSRDESEEPAGRKRRRRKSSDRPEKTRTSARSRDTEVDVEDDMDDIQEGRGSKASGQARKMPTWSDTVDVIVDSNIASRSRKPPRKKRGGRRRGGQNRSRD